MVAAFLADIQNRALRKLRLLDAAQKIEDLKSPPGNHLEMLSGSRAGQMSIRVNMQWRLCFIWKGQDSYEAEIIDYH